MSLIVLYFLHSTSVLSFYIDVVLTLSTNGMQLQYIPTTSPWFCCAWFWCDRLVRLIYLYSVGLICWSCYNQLIFPKPIGWPWRIWVKLTGAMSQWNNRGSPDSKPRIMHTCLHDSWLTFWPECTLTWTIFSRPRWLLIVFSALACISTFVNV